MAAIGGSIESITISGREFAVAADAESNRQNGGDSNEVMMNGDGSARLVKTKMPFILDGLAVVIDEDRADSQFLQSTADKNSFFALGITYVGGTVYQGTGQIIGEISTSSKNATATISLSGTKLEKQG